jgi:hypothetical protein
MRAFPDLRISGPGGPTKQSPSIVSAEDDGVGIMTEVNYGGTGGTNSIE